MSHRTQITLTDAQYERLCRESKRTGLGLAELVRRAVDQAYGHQAYAHSDREELLAAINEASGAWADREDIEDGAAYVERLRRGMAHRLASDDNPP